MRYVCGTVIVLGCALFQVVAGNGITVNLQDQASIKSAARIVADGLMNYYHGNETGREPGLFDGGYYWWESGAAWGSMLDYWFYTGDDTYVDVAKQGMLYQVGTGWDYMPKEQTLSLGNDDQGFWGITAMMAAERNFTNPASNQPQWLALAQAVFNSIALVWDTQYCDGGVRWQKFVFNNGYDYKNSISNGVLFQLGARLQRYTQNETYGYWAEKVWDWESTVGFIDNSTYYVYDGASVESNCEAINKIQWTYNTAVYMAGAAYMYNYTQSDTWKTRLDNLISTLDVFLYGSTNIIYEPACEPAQSCNPDQQSFKAYMARWLGATIQLAPYTSRQLFPILTTSANAAISTCNGGSDGVTCGYTWLTGTYDGKYGLGEQMAALEVLQSQLIPYSVAPYTNNTGGSSIGNPNAGTGLLGSQTSTTASTTKDKAGAWVITIVLTAIALVTSIWLAIDGMGDTKKLQEWIRLESHFG
ncbi:glycosyl hydrolase family 76-domain-containing protein [Lipomyces kononenkoae]